MIRVFIADDHAIVRQGLRNIIEAAGDMQVVGEAADGHALLARSTAADEWDVLILDLSLPKVSGIAALERLRVSHPKLAIVVLSMYGEEQYGASALKAGAAAYLSKDRSGDELLAAIRKVAKGGRYVTETVADQLAAGATGDKLPHERLTAREYQVFLLLVHGRTVSEVAAELDVTAGTVSGHLMKVKEKLGAKSVPEILRYAARVGLIE
ncbi:MAG: response regulator transcription factor [Polyangiaceae bacterium]